MNTANPRSGFRFGQRICTVLDWMATIAHLIAPPMLRIALALPFFRSGLTRWDGFLSLSEVMWWTALPPRSGGKLWPSNEPCVDGPPGARGKDDRTVGRVHPCVRPVFAAGWLLALMKSADRNPNHLNALEWRLVPVGLFGPRPDRFVITSHHPRV